MISFSFYHPDTYIWRGTWGFGDVGRDVETASARRSGDDRDMGGGVEMYLDGGITEI